jgi:SAM-dependent methyltransferase
LPFQAKSFDLVCAFDVIEHIDDGEPALQEIYRVLKPDGSMIITVPALMSLWSQHDDVNHHYLRYTKTTLRNATRKFFKEKYCSYYNCLLFPVIATQRYLAKIFPFQFKKEGAGSDFSLKLPSFFEESLFWFFQSERHLIKYHIRLPVGVSILYEGRPEK